MLNHCLFITRKLPHPEDTGALQYSAHLLRIIANIFQSVSVVCQLDEETLPPGNSHESFPVNVCFYPYNSEKVSLAAKLFSTYPMATLKMAGRAARETLIERLDSNSPDIIVVDHIGATWSIPILKNWLKRHCTTKVIYCTHNEEFSTRRSIMENEIKRPAKYLAHSLDAFRAWNTDRNAIKISSAVTCISKQDIHLYSKLHRPRHIELIPAIYKGVVKPVRSFDNSISKKVCIVGSFLWTAKKNNLNQFLEACHERFLNHDIELHIIGNMENEYLQRMRRRWVGVTFSGYVDDVNMHMDGMNLGIIAEEAGGGFKLKTLDYVFQMIPIFALEHAIDNELFHNGHSIMTYSDMNTLTSGIIREIDNVQLLQDLAHNAHNACNDLLDEEKAERQMKELILMVKAES